MKRLQDDKRVIPSRQNKGSFSSPCQIHPKRHGHYPLLSEGPRVWGLDKVSDVRSWKSSPWLVKNSSDYQSPSICRKEKGVFDFMARAIICWSILDRGRSRRDPRTGRNYQSVLGEDQQNHSYYVSPCYYFFLFCSQIHLLNKISNFLSALG